MALFALDGSARRGAASIRRPSSQHRLAGNCRCNLGQRHLRFEPLEQRRLPAVITWDGGGGNLYWGDPLNWDTDALPGPWDDVVIPAMDDEMSPPILLQEPPDQQSGDEPEPFVAWINSLRSESSLTIDEGSLAVRQYEQVSGDLWLEGDRLGVEQLTIGAGASLGGYGTIGGSVTNHGTIHIGQSDWQTGILTIDGDYTQTEQGVLAVDIAGTTPGTGHDQLAVTGAATIENAELWAVCPSGYDFAHNDEFAVLTYASLDGKFDRYQTSSHGTHPLFPTALHRSDATYVTGAVGWVGGDGRWDDPTHWTTGAVPGEEDDVWVFGIGEPLHFPRVSYYGEQTVRRLSVEGGTFSIYGSLESSESMSFDTNLFLAGELGGTGSLAIKGQMLWRGGRITGGDADSVFWVGADLTIDSLSTELRDRTLILSGDAQLAAGSVLTLHKGASIDIRPLDRLGYTDPTLTIESGVDLIDGDGTTSLLNAGTIVYRGTSDQSPMPRIENEGTVTIESGNLTTTSYRQTSGQTTLAGGQLTSPVVDIEGGTLFGRANPG